MSVSLFPVLTVGMSLLLLGFSLSSPQNCLSISFAATPFSFFAINAVKSSTLFGRVKRPSHARWSCNVKETIKEKRKAFGFVHKSEGERKLRLSSPRLRHGMKHVSFS